MLMYDSENLYKKLVKECVWNEEVAKITCKTLSTLDARLQIPLDKWLKGEKADDFIFEGISIRKIMFRYKFSFILALYRMDILMKDNKQRENFKKIMNEPVFID